MAGHNKWSQIKHKKAKEDGKKSKIYTTYHRQPSHPKAEYFQFPLLLTPDIVNFGNNIGYQLQPALHHRRAL